MRTVLIGAQHGLNDMFGEWICERMDGQWVPGRGQAICVVDSQHGILGGAIFDSFNGASVCAHIAGRKDKLWAKPDFFRLCFTYAFDQLGARKVIGLVGADNITAQRFDEHLGFVLEATLRDAHPSGDLLLYTMTREQCRWIQPSLRNDHEQAEGPQST